MLSVPVARSTNRCQRRPAIVMTLDLGDEATPNEVRLVEVGPSPAPRIRPLDVQQNRDATRSHDRLGDGSVDTLAEKPNERSEHIGPASTPVRMVVVAPAGVIGEKLPEGIHVLRGER